jgi:hypothetical protein
VNVVKKERKPLEQLPPFPTPQKPARAFPLNGRIRRATPIVQETRHPSTTYSAYTTPQLTMGRRRVSALQSVSAQHLLLCALPTHLCMQFTPRAVSVCKIFLLLLFCGLLRQKCTKPVFLNIYGAQDSIPRNEFRQPIWPSGLVR